MRFLELKYGVAILVSLMASLLLFKIVDLAYLYSEHPISSILVKFIFLMIFLTPLIFKKKEMYIYYFILSFPFFAFIGRGISLINMFALIFLIMFHQEISKVIREKRILFAAPFYIFLFALIYTSLFCQFPQQAFQKSFFYLSYVIIFIAVTAYASDEKNLRNFTYFVLFIFVFCCFISFFQVIFGMKHFKFTFGEFNQNTGIYGHVKRIPSVFEDAQAAGQYFSTMSMLLAGIFMYHFKNKRIAAWVFMLGSICLFLTISRLAIITYMIGIVLAALIASSKRKILIILVMPVLAASLYLGYQGMAPKGLTERFEIHNQKESFAYRFNLWKYSLPIITHNPLGVGLGGFNRYYAGEKVGFDFPDSVRRTREFTNFESSYLSLLYSLGFTGFGAFVMLVVSYFKSGISLFQIHGVKSAYYLIIARLIWLVTSAISPQMEEFKSMTTFTLLFAYMNSIYNIFNRKSVNPS